jgi:hypothetical protein
LTMRRRPVLPDGVGPALLRCHRTEVGEVHRKKGKQRL